MFTTMGSAAAAAAAGKLGAEDGGEGEQQQQQLWPAWKQQFIDAIEYDSKASEDGEEPGECGALGCCFCYQSNACWWWLWWCGGGGSCDSCCCATCRWDCVTVAAWNLDAAAS